MVSKSGLRPAGSFLRPGKGGLGCSPVYRRWRLAMQLDLIG